MKAKGRRWLPIAAGASLAAVSGAVAYGRYVLPGRLPLPHAVEGERRTVHGRAGPLSFYVAGSGPPVLLIHSINAAASAYEVKPLYEALAAERRVYAVDLPGFGLSDRSDRAYSIRLYVDAIHDMLDVIAGDAGEGPVDALALSLSSEFLARAATERLDRFRTLAFVTPTGFERGADLRRGPEGGAREVPGLYRGLTVPIWSRGLYKLLVTRPSIRFFLEKTWGSKEIDEGLLDYDYLTTHQPGAEHAPFAFVSGRLFSTDIRTVYERLTMPALIMHGTRGDFQDFSTVGWTKDRPNWRVRTFDAGALAHFERLSAVLAAYREFRDAPPAQ